MCQFSTSNLNHLKPSPLVLGSGVCLRVILSSSRLVQVCWDSETPESESDEFEKILLFWPRLGGAGPTQFPMPFIDPIKTTECHGFLWWATSKRHLINKRLRTSPSPASGYLINTSTSSSTIITIVSGLFPHTHELPWAAQDRRDFCRKPYPLNPIYQNVNHLKLGVSRIAGS